jgi:acyl-CoA hydrolase
MPTVADWRERYPGKLCTAADAVAIVKPGDTVYAGGWTSVPVMLCRALADRHAALNNVTVFTFLTPVNWDQPDYLKSFRIVSAYAGPFERAAVRAGRFEYVPVVQWRTGHIPPGFDRDFDVMLVPISPPDEDGFCSFGGGVWFGPSVSARAKKLVGEVHPEFVRTGGQNRIHISRFERIAEYNLPPAPPPIAPRSDETELAANVICTLVATELVKDGATLQFGVGDVSAAMPVFLGDKHDLGVHTEILPGGIVDLVKQGVVNGRLKARDAGKVVASAVVQLPEEELDFIDGNDTFELYDFTYTDDLRTILDFDNFVAINNALAVDLTGNVSSETQGPQVFSGPGGQPSFAIGASTGSGGSVIVLPASQLVGDIRHPRIVAAHPAGTTVSVHRGFVDYVVTEQGIASLRGKTLRDRISELISVAHPDFRAELRHEAAKLYGVTV